MQKRKIVIAIDGPAASGKSTTAKQVAQRLGYLHIDTGAMYRAVTLAVLQNEISPSDETAVAKLAAKCEIRLEPKDDGNRVILNGKDVSSAVRKPEVTRNVSAVSSYPDVRKVMVREQQRIAKAGGAVLEGRDIGTVVLPKADLKVYMVANVTERARRRKKELAQTGVEIGEDDLVREIEERDRKDSSRNVSPLRKAEDAIEIDTSNLTIEEQVATIVKRAEALIAGKK